MPLRPFVTDLGPLKVRQSMIISVSAFIGSGGGQFDYLLRTELDKE